MAAPPGSDTLARLFNIFGSGLFTLAQMNGLRDELDNLIIGNKLDIGSDGDAGTLSIWPPDAASGHVTLTATDNAGDTVTSIVVGAMADVRALTIPDPGADGVFMIAQGSGGFADGLLVPTFLSLGGLKNTDGTGLSTSASSGKFGISVTPGTSQRLLGEAANSSTVTDVAMFEFMLPAHYRAGVGFAVVVNAKYTLGSGTIGTHTLALAAYACNSDGTQGANLVTTSAQAVSGSGGTVAFNVSGTALTAGSRVMFTLTMVIQDTGGHAITGQINSISLH